MSVDPRLPPSPAPVSETTEGSVRLGHWGLLRAQGADAASFLHGQLTNDVTNLPAQAVRLAGFCSAKGRLQASFQLWQQGPDELLLACHASVLPATLKRLSMFVLRAKCKLSDAGAGDAGLVATGLVGATAARALAAAGLVGPATHRAFEGGELLALSPVEGLARAVWMAPAAVALPATAPALPLATWHRLEVLSGLPVIEAATVDQFVPQMLNYELVGGVDFRKGCYPGQEVVARSQYRGTVKRRSFLFDLPAGTSAAPGQEIFHSEDPAQPAGMVVNAADTVVLAEVKLAALPAGSLHLGAADGALMRRRELPYAVPTDPVIDA